MKKLSIIILSLLFITITACSDKKDEKSGETIKIGLAAHSYSDQWATYVFSAIEAAVKEYPNVELTILDAKDDTGIQLSQIETLITTGHDAIILYAVDRASIGNMGRIAKEAGVIVTAVNRVPEDQHLEYIDLYVGIDEKEAGIAAGKQFLADLEAEGRLNEEMKIGNIQGILGQEAAVARSAGFAETIAGYPNLKITHDGTARWERGLAVNLVENWLQADVDDEIKAIFANNDEMAVGAILAINQSGRDDIKVYGIDASPAGVNAIGNGLNATIEQDPIGMGRAAVDITLRKLRGEPLDDLVDGKFNYIPLNTVTTKNKEEFLKKAEEINTQ